MTSDNLSGVTPYAAHPEEGNGLPGIEQASQPGVSLGPCWLIVHLRSSPVKKKKKITGCVRIKCDEVCEHAWNIVSA